MNEASSFWKAAFGWTTVGLAVVLLYLIVTDPSAWLGGADPSPWRRFVADLPWYTGLVAALAAFGAGLALVGASRRPPNSFVLREVVRLAVLLAALSYLLTALVDPVVEYAFDTAVDAAALEHYPLGPEMPWTLLRLSELAESSGFSPSQGMPADVANRTYAFSFYFPLLIGILGALNGVSGFLVGHVMGPRRTGGERSLYAWVLWLAYVGSFVVGTRAAIDLMRTASWSAEAVAPIPIAVAAFGTALLLWAEILRNGSRGHTRGRR